jgi:tetratricopeptide (TPR) repeat protein
MRILILSILFVVSNIIAVSFSAASISEGWQALLRNNYALAQEQFSAAQDPQGEEALQGLFITAWAESNSPGMVERLTALITRYPNSPYLPAYLSFCSNPNLQGWLAADRIQVMEEALKQCTIPASRELLHFELSEALNMQNDPRVATSARHAGILLDHWNIVGPFGQNGFNDFFYPFGPEKKWAPSYNGWQKEVAWKSYEHVDAMGTLEIDSLIDPALGVAYAVNVVSVDEDCQARLSVFTPSNIRVWLNNEPLMQKNHVFLQSGKVLSAPVSLSKGKNILIIKTEQVGPWWLRASLQSMGAEPLRWKSVPFQPDEFASLFIKPFETKEIVDEQCKALCSVYPGSLTGRDILNTLFLAEWHQERSEFSAAREHIESVIETHPAFAFPHVFYGDISMRWASVRSGSKARFQREAESAFQKALELDPHARGALIGLQSYYLDRDQADQALEGFDAHLQAYPDLLEQGYPGMLHYSHGLLYSRKNFQAESIQKFKDVLDGFVPSLNVYSHLFDYYERNHDIKNAMTIAQKALAVFPANPAFLNMASRLPAGELTQLGLLEKIEAQLALHPNSLRIELLLGRLFEKLGDTQAAQAWYQKLQKKYPDNAHIVEEQTRQAFLASDRGTALQLAQSVYKQEPRRRDAYRILRDVADRSDFAYLQYDVNLDDVDIDKAQKWKNSRASGIFLLDIMVVEIHDDGTYDQYIHQAIQILNQQGIDNWAEIVIPSGANVEIIKARTLTPDGTEWAVSHVQDLNNQQSLSMYGLEPDAIVEYAFLQRAGSPEPGRNAYYGGYFFGADDDPMLLSQITIVKPKHIPLHLDSNPDDFAPVVIDMGDTEVYTWTREMQDGLKPERFAPSLSERVTSIEWSTCPDWQPYVERYRNSKWGYEEVSDEVSRIAESFKKETASKIEYAQNVFEWIRDSIENASGGTTTADTVALKAGGLYQKMRLAHQLLTLGGIESRTAVIVDHDRNNGFRPLPQVNYPGGTVLYIPRQKEIPERLFLDFSSRFAPFNQISPGLYEKVAFVFDGPVPFFEPLDSRFWDHGLILRKAQFTVHKDQSASVTGEYVYDDMYDRQIREILTNPEVEKRLANTQLAQDLQGIQLQSYTLEDVNDLTVPPRLVYEGTMPDVVKPAGEAFALKVTPVYMRTNASALVTDVTRESNIRFNNTVKRDLLKLQFDFADFLDQGASIELPEDVFLLTEYGYYAIFYEWHGTKVMITRSILLPRQTIEKSKYTGFVEFCRNIDQAEDRDIRIVLPNKLP